jgi:phage terminase large subunit-like protein
MQARPNPQLWVTSNAGDIHSVILNSIRDRAMHKIENDTDDDLMYMEWSAHQDRRLGDIEGWREANPALGHTIQLETLKARMSDPPEVIQTEMLCQWVTTMNSAFPQGSWNSCAQPTLELKNDRPTWLGLEISPERDYWALCGTQVLDDKSIAVGLMEHVQTETPIDDLQIASRVADWAKKYNAESVVANRFTGDSVVAKLKQAGIRAEVIQGAKYYQACDESLSAISGLRVRHSSQPELTNAVNSCTKRTNDSGAWYIMRRKASTAAIAMVLAISKATEYGQRSDTDIAIA